MGLDRDGTSAAFISQIIRYIRYNSTAALQTVTSPPHL